MNSAANSKSLLLIDAASVGSGATQTASIDTLGFNFARVNVHQSIVNSATVLKIEQSDDNTNFVTANITGGTDFTVGTNNTNATTAPYYAFDIPLGGKRRYLKVSITPGASANIVATATLSKPGLGEDAANAANTFSAVG